MHLHDTIRVVIADDHPMLCHSLRRLLELAGDICVLAEFGDAAALMAGMNGLSPDVLILDINMPGPGPVEVVSWMRARYPSAAVVALTAHDEDHYLSVLENSGAASFLFKADPPEVLIMALHSIAQGQTLWTQEQWARARQWREEVEIHWLSLTEREREVACLAALGMDTRQVAEALQIGPRTVEFHMGNILTKLDVPSRLAAAVWIRDNLPREWWRGSKTRQNYVDKSW